MITYIMKEPGLSDVFRTIWECRGRDHTLIRSYRYEELEQADRDLKSLMAGAAALTAREEESERLAGIARTTGGSVVIEACGNDVNPRPAGGAILQQQDCHTPQFDRIDWWPTLDAAMTELQRMAAFEGVTVTGCRAAFSWGTAEVKV